MVDCIILGGIHLVKKDSKVLQELTTEELTVGFFSIV